MKKSTLSILILSSLLLAEAKANEPSPLLAEYCEAVLDDSRFTTRCVNSQVSSEHLNNCQNYREYYNGPQTDEMFVSCLEANIGHAFHCRALGVTFLERGECLKIVKGSNVSQDTISACYKWPKGKRIECLKTVTELDLNVEDCEPWPTDKKMECLEILKAQKQ